jgi:predicted ABC-type transport system involved in lysophospholipase L1 biosynthesis ATPase subunit
LYEAISGVLPIDGRNTTVLLQRKLSHDPQPLREGAPSEVLDLCMALLARDPLQRPSGTKVIEMLAAASGGVREPTTVQEHLTIEPGLTVTAPTLYGRDAELAQLHAASDSLERRTSFVVHVRGTSGSGKSTLVEHFLDEAASSGLTPPVVLRSRCYEREAMPFKALDGVVDALVSHLSQLDDISCAHLLPTDVADLARLFPVFDRLGAVQRLRAAQRMRGDETQSRRRAEQALRALVTSVAANRRLLLWIDDMQWGDLDSASMLRAWLEQPLPASVLVVLSYRTEEIHTSSSLAVEGPTIRNSLASASASATAR